MASDTPIMEIARLRLLQTFAGMNGATDKSTLRKHKKEPMKIYSSVYTPTIGEQTKIIPGRT